MGDVHLYVLPSDAGRMMRRRSALVSLLLVLIVLVPGPAVAGDAEDELGNWLIYNGTVKFADKWSLFTEAQLRLWEPASNPQEFFARAIGLYQTSKRTQLGLGYTWVKTEPFEDEAPDGTENRLIEQFSVKQFPKSTVLEHRFRFEQRWLEKEGETNYRNRFRYRLQATTPLGKEKIEPKTHFLNFTFSALSEYYYTATELGLEAFGKALTNENTTIVFIRQILSLVHGR